MDKIRAFIAIELSDVVKRELNTIISVLKKAGTAPVKWVEPGNIHLTLKFLGDIDTGKIGSINDSVAKAIAGIHPFRLAVKGLGVFPNPKRTQVAWVGVSGDLEELNHLQESIETEMEMMGFPRETRRFSPHLTLARVRDNASSVEREKFGIRVTETTFDAGIIQVESVNIMRSLLTREGAIYTRLGSIRLH